MEPSIFHGMLPFLIEGPIVSRGKKGVMDSFQATLLCSENWVAEAQALGYQVERKIPGFASLWVEQMEDEAEGPGVVRVSVRGSGIAGSGDKRVRRISAGGREWSIGPHEKVVLAWTNDEQGEDDGSPVEQVKRRVPKLDDDGDVVYKSIATPSGIGDRWTIKEAIVTVSDTYYTIFKPEVNMVGGIFTPPNPPTPPPYLWAGYNEAMRFRHPNGWVLDERSVEDEFVVNDSLGLWRVTDTCGYYYPAAPD